MLRGVRREDLWLSGGLLGRISAAFETRTDGSRDKSKENPWFEGGSRGCGARLLTLLLPKPAAPTGERGGQGEHVLPPAVLLASAPSVPGSPSLPREQDGCLPGKKHVDVFENHG